MQRIQIETKYKDGHTRLVVSWREDAMMYSLLETGSSAEEIPTCRSHHRDKLDGHKAMLVSLGVSFSADEVTCNLEMG